MPESDGSHYPLPSSVIDSIGENCERSRDLYSYKYRYTLLLISIIDTSPFNSFPTIQNVPRQFEKLSV